MGYARKADHSRIETAAQSHIAGLGPEVAFPSCAALVGGKDFSRSSDEYSWLRLYFDEVIWPEAEKVKKHVQDAELAGNKVVKIINGMQSKDAVKEEVERFVREKMPTSL